MPWQKRIIAHFYLCKANPNQRDKYDPISHWDLGSRHLPPTSLNIRGPFATSDLAHCFKLQTYILGKTKVTQILFSKSFFFSWTTLICHSISLFRNNLPSLNISHIFSSLSFSVHWHNCTSRTSATKMSVWKVIESIAIKYNTEGIISNVNLDIFLNKVFFQEDHFTRLKFKCIGYFVGFKPIPVTKPFGSLIVWKFHMHF